jgi:WD40 repeat protein
MKNKRFSSLAFATIRTLFVVSSLSMESSWSAQAPGGASAPLPEMTLIRDKCLSEVFLRYSPDGRELARIPQFGPVYLSDPASFKKLRTFKVGMRMVAYSQDGTLMATAEGTDGARVWDAMALGVRLPEAKSTEVYMLETPRKVLEVPVQDRAQRVFWVEFSPDGKRLVTTQANGHVKVWSTSSWSLEDDLGLTQSEVRAAAFSPDSKTLVFGDANGALYQWNFERKSVIHSGLTSGSQGAVMGVVFAPDGKTVVTSHQSGPNGYVRICKTDTGVAQLEEGFSCAAISRDGKILALGGREIRLFDLASGRPVRTIALAEMTLREINPRFENKPNADQKIPVQINALAFSPDGSTLAVGNKGPLHLVKLGPW